MIKGWIIGPTIVRGLLLFRVRDYKIFAAHAGRVHAFLLLKARRNSGIFGRRQLKIVLEWIRRTHAHVKARWENVIKRYFSSYTLTHPYAPIRTYTHPYAPNRTKTHSKPHQKTHQKTHLKTHIGARKSCAKIAQKMECKISGRHSFKYI